MAINTATVVASLEAEYTANLTKIAALPAADVSSMGRSISSGSARDALNKRQREIEKTLAQLGSPIGTIDVPFALRSRVKA